MLPLPVLLPPLSGPGEHTNVTRSPSCAGTSAVGVATRNVREVPSGACMYMHDTHARAQGSCDAKLGRTWARCFRLRSWCLHVFWWTGPFCHQCMKWCRQHKTECEEPCLPSHLGVFGPAWLFNNMHARAQVTHVHHSCATGLPAAFSAEASTHCEAGGEPAYNAGMGNVRGKRPRVAVINSEAHPHAHTHMHLHNKLVHGCWGRLPQDAHRTQGRGQKV